MADLSEQELERQRIVESIEICKEIYKSSSDELDKQLVSLAGGGLAITIGFFKDIAAVISAKYLWLLLSTWVCFTLTLLFNLYSHRVANAASDASLTLWDYRKHCLDFKQDKNSEYEASLEAKTNAANNWVHRLNKSCMVLVTAGVILFVIFTLCNLLNARPASQSSSNAQQSVGTRPNQRTDSTINRASSYANPPSSNSTTSAARPYNDSKNGLVNQNMPDKYPAPKGPRPDEIRGLPLPSITVKPQQPKPSEKLQPAK